MVFGTPSEDYVPSRGAALLRSMGKGTVSRAKDGLLGRGFLSKLVKGSQRPKPGRTLKISEMCLVLHRWRFRVPDCPFRNQNALGGSIPQELFNEATTLDALYGQQEAWREWPLRASDGDLAMLLQLTSEGLVSHRLIEIKKSIDGIKSQVDFKLDITGAKAARSEIDWNSKKAGQ